MIVTSSSADNMMPITVRDVTSNVFDLEFALQLVASGYAKLSTRSIAKKEVYEELCQDKYLATGKARVLLAETIDIQKQEPMPLGTMRFIIGNKPKPNASLELVPFEFMSLLLPNNEWSFFDDYNFDLDSSIEISRLSFVPYSKSFAISRSKFTVDVTHALITYAAKIAKREYGKTQVWGMMPRYIARMIENSGIKLLPCSNLKLNTAQHQKLFDLYDRYWVHKPNLYYLDIE
jgi:hypothetical protein